MARLNHPNIARSQSEYDTVYWDTTILPFIWQNGASPGRTRLLTKTRLEPLHSVLSEYDPGRIIRILPGHNTNMILSVRIQRFWVILTKWSLPGRTRLLTKTRLEPLHLVLFEYDPGRIIRILPGHNPNMTLSIRIKRFLLFWQNEASQTGDRCRIIRHNHKLVFRFLSRFIRFWL